MTGAPPMSLNVTQTKSRARPHPETMANEYGVQMHINCGILNRELHAHEAKALVDGAVHALTDHLFVYEIRLMPPPSHAEALELSQAFPDDAAVMWEDIVRRELEGRTFEYSMECYISLDVFSPPHRHLLDAVRSRIQELIAEFSEPTVIHRLASWGASPAVATQRDFVGECPVCFGDHADIILPCGHRICRHCETRLVYAGTDTPKCPSCRAAFEFVINTVD